MSRRLRGPAFYAAAVGVVVVVAYGVGKLAATYSNRKDNRHYLNARSLSTDGIVAQMNSIKVGGILPDHLLKTLEGQSIELSELIQARTLLFFFDPGCPSCHDQIEMMEEIASTAEKRNRFLIISRADLRQLLQARNEMGIKCRILWDSAGVFHDELNIRSSPFSVIVDKARVIASIVAGRFLNEELIGIANLD